MGEEDLSVPVEFLTKSTDGTEKWETLGIISNEIEISLTDEFSSDIMADMSDFLSGLKRISRNPKYMMRLFYGSKTGSKTYPLNAKQVVGFLNIIKRCRNKQSQYP